MAAGQQDSPGHNWELNSLHAFFQWQEKTQPIQFICHVLVCQEEGRGFMEVQIIPPASPQFLCIPRILLPAGRAHLSRALTWCQQHRGLSVADSLSRKQKSPSFLYLQPCYWFESVLGGICSPDEDRQVCDRRFAESKKSNFSAYTIGTLMRNICLPFSVEFESTHLW